MTPTKKFIQEKAEKPKIAYIITDKYFPDLEVVDSSNAWWLDRGKTERLISAFKIDSSVMEACVYAGITLDQYKYFCQVHAQFSTIKQLCSELPCLQARQEVVKGIKDDKEFSLKYLERKRKNEFAVKQYVEQEGDQTIKHELSTPMMELLKKAGELVEPKE